MAKENIIPTQEDSTASLLEEASSKIGRNLMFYQEIEIRLKNIVPYIHPESKKGIDNFRNVKKILSDKTLGMMFGELIKFIEVDDSSNHDEKAFEKYIKKINDDRNELVHNLMTLPGMNFNDSSGCKNVILYLDQKLDDIKFVIDLLDVMSNNILSMYESAETDEFGRVKESISSNLFIRVIF